KQFGVSKRAAFNAAMRLSYAWVADTTAEQERRRRAVEGVRDEARRERTAELDQLTIVALERAAPPQNQVRRRAPHTPPTRAPRSKGTK
ncbi:MAG TPA: hypothetical protein VGB85_01045, partial [Nannocystis sp.]